MGDSTPQKERRTAASTSSDCPACGSSELDDSLPELGRVCSDCGAVASANIDFEPQTDDVDTDREDHITWSEESSVTNSTEHRVAIALEVLEDIGSQLSLPPSIRERAAEIYADAVLETITDGRPTEVLVAACITIASRVRESPIPAARVAAVADVEMDQLRQAGHELRREIGLETSPCGPEAYLDSLATELQLGPEAQALAERIIATIPSASVGGKHPAAITGAALYLASNGAVTQREVATATTVTTETIRLRVKECREAVDISDWSEPAHGNAFEQ